MANEIDNAMIEAVEAVEPAMDQQLQIPEELPLLPLRDIVIYPFMGGGVGLVAVRAGHWNAVQPASDGVG